MHLSRGVAALAGVASIALVLSGCGQNSGQQKKTITTSADTELTTVDPSKTTAVGTFNVLNNVDEGLVRLGKDSKVEPGIATDWTVSKDGKTYTYNLRKGAKWSNGDPVTAQNFVYSWQRTLNPKTASQYGYLFSGIKNADKIQNKKAKVSTLGIKADGKYKLTVKPEQRIPYFNLLMGFPVFFPQDSNAVKKFGNDYGTSSKTQVYNGPFTLTKWTGTNNTWTLKKNKDYWDKKQVKLDNINFKVQPDTSTSLNLYNQGKLDMAQLSATQAKQMGNKKDLISRKQSSNYYIAVNQKSKVFKNLKIRQAMSMIINRKVLANKVMGGGAINNKSFVSEGLAVSPKNGTDFTKDTTVPASMDYNPTKAKQLFKQGLQEVGRTSLHFTLLNSDGSDQKQLSEYLQSALQKLPGLKVTLNNIPGRAILSRQASGQFTVTVANWFADFSDPITFLNILTYNNPSNISGWKNSQYDSLIKDSNADDGSNANARWDDMVKAQNIALKDQAIIPLYQSGEKWMVNSKVKGIVYNTAGANYNFKEAYVK
ncbi:peptide ABC transporter substrate-binding protein [Lentilactobacillus kefiri]|uniref:ABC transporter periplasmic protein n=2 Tax=Lentilactobacillus kefiri TaxID=33962 RepID=A0A8E1V2H5_LENKE|nr:peptide ABC transporter substrate-binding protein [Lentilactobacillus kefiri]KRL58797.1 ABC transporter periplasmic protein [Lentilactobacillus parakefiri DSM 10551]KRM53756.1 ABC transporter periplasmic protein [Lentilactobacillus kefiri DSM 20587 = JCM 5818]GEL27902.1 peptide ABC transporter substrate-binding protein [Lentilactobacillus kefiri]